MTYAELIDEVAKQTGLKKTEVTLALNVFKDKVIDVALSGEEIRIPKFGKFARKVIKSRPIHGIGGAATSAPTGMSKERTTIKFKSFV